MRRYAAASRSSRHAAVRPHVLDPQFWYDFLGWEHTTDLRSTFHGEYQLWEAYPSRISPEEEDDDDDYDVVKEEAHEAMEDAAPPGADDLPPKY
jgi:hypothetical protein